MDQQEVLISQSGYLDIIEGSIQGIWIHIDFKPVFVNQSCLRIFGYKKEQFLGLDSILQCVPVGEHKRVKGYMSARLSGLGAPIEYEFEGLHRNGSIVHLINAVSVIDWGDKKAVLSMLTDITARKKAEAKIKESEKKLYKIFESSPDVILVTRIKDGILLDANRNFEPLFGHKKEDALGKSTVELSLWARPEEREEVMAQIIANGGIRYMNTQYRKRNGDIADCYLSCEVVELGGEACLVSTLRDNSEQIAMQKKLRQSEEKFSKAFQSSPEILIITHISDGRIIEVNNAFEKLSGWSREEALGRTSLELEMWIKEERDGLMQKILQTGSIANVDVIFMTKNKEKRHGEMSAEVINISSEPCLLSIVNDATERKLTEEKLRDSEEKLFKVFESSPDVIMVTQLNDGVIIDVNKNFEPVFGYSKEEAIGKTAVELKIWARPEQREKLIARVMKDGNIKYLENQYRRRNGEVSDCYLSCEVVYIHGEPCLVSTLRDISEQKAMQTNLRQSEEKFSKAFLSSPQPIAISNLATGTLLEINDAFEEVFEYSKEELIGTSSLELSLWSDPQSRAIFVERMRTEGEVRGFESDAITKSGKLKNCYLSAELISIENEVCLVIIIQDVTEQKKAEEEIIQSRERLRNFAHRLEEVREEERIGIAREVHDELGQALTGLKIDLNWLLENVPDKKTVTQHINEMINNIDTTVNVVRKISSDLRPPVLDDLGLEAAIEWTTDEFTKRTNISHHLNVDCEELEIDMARDTAVFRIYQEILTNIARHSQASSFKASIRISNDELKLWVKDNGIGITNDQIEDNTSIGLLGMQERAAHINSQIVIQNAKDSGTEIFLTVPLST